jgi:hypothetical protein
LYRNVVMQKLLKAEKMGEFKRIEEIEPEPEGN